MASITGTTVNAYVNALEWVCHSFDKNTLLIKNTHIANALKVKVSVLADPAGVERPLELTENITERILAAGDTQTVNLLSPYHTVYVAIKSNVGGLHASYQVDSIGGLQR